MQNSQIADRLEAFASLLELADANPYAARAYRRVAETIRGTPASVAELVRSGRVRELRGVGRSIEGKLRDWWRPATSPSSPSSSASCRRT